MRSRGQGIEELASAIDRFAERAQASGAWQRRRLDRARAEVAALALTRLRATLTLDNRAELDDLARAVRDAELDPFTAADRLLAAAGLTACLK